VILTRATLVPFLHDEPPALLVAGDQIPLRQRLRPPSHSALQRSRDICPRLRMIDTRQLRSLAAVDFCLALFIGFGGKDAPRKIMAADAERESARRGDGRNVP